MKEQKPNNDSKPKLGAENAAKVIKKRLLLFKPIYLNQVNNFYAFPYEKI